MRLKSNAGVQQNRMIGLRPIDSNGNQGKDPQEPTGLYQST